MEPSGNWSNLEKTALALPSAQTMRVYRTKIDSLCAFSPVAAFYPVKLIIPSCFLFYSVDFCSFSVFSVPWHRFGGTDSQFHYNDVWSFDTKSLSWTLLTCTGFIMAPREGHSATIIDNIIYIFGGRAADGSDLGDLGALRVSSKLSFVSYCGCVVRYT